MDAEKKAAEIERLKQIARKGGENTAKKHGTEHMREIGSKGGKKRWK